MLASSQSFRSLPVPVEFNARAVDPKKSSSSGFLISSIGFGGLGFKVSPPAFERQGRGFRELVSEILLFRIRVTEILDSERRMAGNSLDETR